MHKLHDFNNGTVVGAIGFFASRNELPAVTRIAIGGIAAFTSTVMVYNHPSHQEKDVSFWSITAGALYTVIAGYALDYAIDSPDYAVVCCLIGCMVAPNLLHCLKSKETAQLTDQKRISV